jgi:hypothetical protein
MSDSTNKGSCVAMRRDAVSDHPAGKPAWIGICETEQDVRRDPHGHTICPSLEILNRSLS